ncbi:hypothetical protein Syun_009521 [Stephania yunnanensis]|uniref:Uncharacterized protein n=1 Tax=Stephania yunnanensis TaxID=152371 RepID=A0AAP0KES9_9MAGN
MNVDYRTIPPKDLAKFVLSEGGWLKLLDSFSRSNFSMAFPFVAASEEISNMEDSLITGFINHCGHDLERKNVLCARVMCDRRISETC